jgi:hypothetical protein
MSTIALRQFVTADASQIIHIKLPPEISGRVEVIILPVSDKPALIPDESLAQAKLMDESGFSRSVLNDPEEDCWNDL